MRSIWQMVLVAGLGLAPAWADAASMEPAQTPSPVDASSSDHRQQMLKLQALQLRAEIGEMAEQKAVPKSERLNIYVARNRKGAALRSITVSVDSGNPIAVDLSADAGAASSLGVLRRIGRIGLVPGPHQLRATALAAAKKPEDEPLRLEIEAAFEKDAGEHNLVIRLADPGLMAAPEIALERWVPGVADHWIARTLKGWSGSAGNRVYAPYSADDPAISHARYLVSTENPEAAVIELEGMKRGIGDLSALPADYWIELARASRAAGLLDRAAAIVDSLDGRKAHRPIIALERLRLAEDAYDRGNLPQTEDLLAKARPYIPPPAAADWRLAYASLLLAQGRAADAAAVLKQADAASIEAFRFMSEGVDALRKAAYRRFNLAVALVQHGDERLGLSWLDLVGRLKSTDDQLLALRDRANLTLGWHFLKAKQGGTAIGILERIRTDGPSSNAALVGIGWAQLEPAGSASWRQSLGNDSIAHPDLSAALPSAMKNSLLQLGVLEPELFGEHGTRPFSADKPPSDRREGLRRAIQVWSLLRQRNPADPSVQEATLAIAYAYDQLGDFAQSRKGYAEAITLLESIHAELQNSAASIRSGELSGLLDQAVSATETFEIMARHGLEPDADSRALYTTIARYLDVSKTSRLLRAAPLLPADVQDAPPQAIDPADTLAGDWTQALRTASDEQQLPARADALAALLDAQRSVDADLIRQLALSQLERRQRTFTEYLKAAYFSAARVEDRELAGDDPAMNTVSNDPAP